MTERDLELRRSLALEYQCPYRTMGSIVQLAELYTPGIAPLTDHEILTLANMTLGNRWADHEDETRRYQIMTAKPDISEARDVALHGFYGYIHDIHSSFVDPILDGRTPGDSVDCPYLAESKAAPVETVLPPVERILVS